MRTSLGTRKNKIHEVVDHLHFLYRKLEESWIDFQEKKVKVNFKRIVREKIRTVLLRTYWTSGYVGAGY